MGTYIQKSDLTMPRLRAIAREVNEETALLTKSDYITIHRWIDGVVAELMLIKEVLSRAQAFDTGDKGND